MGQEEITKYNMDLGPHKIVLEDSSFDKWKDIRLATTVYSDSTETELTVSLSTSRGSW